MLDHGEADGVQRGGRDPKAVSRHQVEWLSMRLVEAEELLKRGVKMLNRLGWEKGETDDEWRKATQNYLNSRKMEDDYERDLGSRHPSHEVTPTP